MGKKLLRDRKIIVTHEARGPRTGTGWWATFGMGKGKKKLHTGKSKAIRTAKEVERKPLTKKKRVMNGRGGANRQNGQTFICEIVVERGKSPNNLQKRTITRGHHVNDVSRFAAGEVNA